jgi:hypothetical protein
MIGMWSAMPVMWQKLTDVSEEHTILCLCFVCSLFYPLAGLVNYFYPEDGGITLLRIADEFA